MTPGFVRARAALGALALLPITTATLPHATLRASDPASGSQLAVAPRRLLLWFTERPQIPFSKIRLVGPDGDVALGRLSADTGNALRVNVLGAMPNGLFKVVWQTGGADGHTVSGDYSFAINAAPPVQDSARTDADSPAASATAPPAGRRVIRLLEFVGLLVVLGVIVFVHGVLPPLAARAVQTADIAQRGRGIGVAAAGVYLVAAAFRLVQQASAVGASVDAPMRALTDIVTHSSWGYGWLLGEVGAVFVIAGFLLSVRRIRAGVPIALTGAFAMLLSPALTGHAAAARLFVPAVTLDALHLAAIGAWLGTLAVVIVVGIPALARVQDGNPDAAVTALVNSFHPIALLAAPLAVLAGLGSSALRLGSIGALTTTRYGEVFMYKLVAVALVAGFGAWNSMRARRRLGTPQGTANLRRSAITEVALGALVLWVTTDLIATPAPAELLKP